MYRDFCSCSAGECGGCVGTSRIPRNDFDIFTFKIAEEGGGGGLCFHFVLLL